ncbi:hypothetical protein QFZ79_000396 [Arthrobacter sp. V4I6]|nr:hypothetical protein [Arthrobacter sp. V1I7]MDQ0852285.1 hypothetical protein [Arthrobacter sp. V4I6]
MSADSLLLSRVALPRRYMGLRDSWGGFAPTAPACTYLQDSPAADQWHIQLLVTAVTASILLCPAPLRKPMIRPPVDDAGRSRRMMPTVAAGCGNHWQKRNHGSAAGSPEGCGDLERFRRPRRAGGWLEAPVPATPHASGDLGGRGAGWRPQFRRPRTLPATSAGGGLVGGSRRMTSGGLGLGCGLGCGSHWRHRGKAATSPGGSGDPAAFRRPRRAGGRSPALSRAAVRRRPAGFRRRPRLPGAARRGRGPAWR